MQRQYASVFGMLRCNVQSMIMERHDSENEHCHELELDGA